MGATVKPIIRERGDTKRIRITFTDRPSGDRLDLTGGSLVLTVNTEQYPNDDSNQVFSLVGEIVDPPIDGVCDFPISTDQADNVGQFFYDVQLTEPDGSVRTILRGPFVLKQDISKEGPFEWMPPTAPADGAAVDLDGSEHFLATAINPISATYETRDGRRVLRVPIPSGTNLVPLGDDFRGRSVRIPGEEFKMSMYLETVHVVPDMNLGAWWHTFGVGINTTAPLVVASLEWAQLWDGTKLISPGLAAIDTSLWSNPGWFTIGLRINTDLTCSAMMKPYDDPDFWQVLSGGSWHENAFPFLWPYLMAYPDSPVGASKVDFWKYEWRKL